MSSEKTVDEKWFESTRDKLCPISPKHWSIAATQLVRKEEEAADDIRMLVIATGALQDIADPLHGQECASHKTATAALVAICEILDKE